MAGLISRRLHSRLGKGSYNFTFYDFVETNPCVDALYDVIMC